MTASLEEREKRRTYLYFTVVTVSDRTLLPTVFAPVSKPVHIAERPGKNKVQITR